MARWPETRLNEGVGASNEDSVIALLAGCDAAIIGREPVTEKVLAALPELQVIGKYGVGCENIDFEALRRHRVRFGYTPGVNRTSVAELALAFAISGLRDIPRLNTGVRSGAWSPSQTIGRELSGRVVGIHGCGNIGKELVRLLQPFNCTILCCDLKRDEAVEKQFRTSFVSFEELIEEAELISIHLPLTRATRNLYDSNVLQRLRPGSVLINTSRGGIVDEWALQRELTSGSLTAACFDVFGVEPPENDHLVGLPNFLATPHIGGSSEEARIAMGRAAILGLSENVIPGLEFDRYS